MLPKDRKALQQVRDDLCSGKITHNAFRMSYWTTHSRDRCGTAHCIGGWAELHSANIISRGKFYYDPRDKPVGYDNSLNKLFCPIYLDQDKWDSTITTCAAIRAIDNTLATGDPNWPEALKDTTDDTR